VDGIFQCRIPTRRLVKDGDCSSDRLGLVEVKRLPHPPHPVQHGMVHPENRVIGTTEEVATVTPDRKVASSVEAKKAIWKTALEFILEGLDVPRRVSEGYVVEIPESQPVCG
jgi:hypothetical protein